MKFKKILEIKLSEFLGYSVKLSFEGQFLYTKDFSSYLRFYFRKKSSLFFWQGIIICPVFIFEGVEASEYFLKFPMTIGIKKEEENKYVVFYKDASEGILDDV